MNRITNEQREAIVRQAVATRDAMLTGAPVTSGWIDAEQRRPEPEVFVLCWDGRKTFVDWFGSKHPREFGVTHWMPYPLPPGSTSEMHDGRRAGTGADNDSHGQDAHAGSPAPSALPLFAVGVAQRKWESLQADGYRMQRIEFARSTDGQEKRGTIDPWGKVLWPVSAQSSKAALSDDEIEDVAHKLFCKDMDEKEGAWGTKALNSAWLNNIALPFARAILARAGIGESRHE